MSLFSHHTTSELNLNFYTEERRMSRRLGLLAAHVNILVICGVLIGAFVVQFGGGEFPARSAYFSAWP